MRPWICPAHTDHDLRDIDLVKDGGRTIRVRRPKKAKIVDPAFPRGFRNNGLIELLNEPSDDDFYEEEGTDGVIYRLPEKAIKLDFVAKVKESRASERQQLKLKRAREEADAELWQPSKRARTEADANLAANMRKHSFAEQQTAMNLMQLAGQNADMDLGADRTTNLIAALIAEAPTDVVASITASEAQRPSSSSENRPPPSAQQPQDGLAQIELMDLFKLQELIRLRIEAITTATVANTNNVATSSAATA
ncbi:hypothetical protein LTR16_007314, partial [Cryomyces antarcticus]